MFQSTPDVISDCLKLEMLVMGKYCVCAAGKSPPKNYGEQGECVSASTHQR